MQRNCRIASVVLRMRPDYVSMQDARPPNTHNTINMNMYGMASPHLLQGDR